MGSKLQSKNFHLPLNVLSFTGPSLVFPLILNYLNSVIIFSLRPDIALWCLPHVFITQKYILCAISCLCFVIDNSVRAWTLSYVSFHLGLTQHCAHQCLINVQRNKWQPLQLSHVSLDSLSNRKITLLLQKESSFQYMKSINKQQLSRCRTMCY